MKKLGFKGYRVNSYYGIDDNTLKENTNTSCFAGIMNIPKENYIYIKDFECEETQKYIPLIIELINKITPCSIVTINRIKYIKFKLLETYDQSLILLNFLRLLWYDPKEVYGKSSFSLSFFRYLSKSRYKDPFKRLTKANKIANEEQSYRYHIKGHSNCFGRNAFGESYKFLILETKDLLNFKGIALVEFFNKKHS